MIFFFIHKKEKRYYDFMEWYVYKSIFLKLEQEIFQYFFPYLHIVFFFIIYGSGAILFSITTLMILFSIHPFLFYNFFLFSIVYFFKIKIYQFFANIFILFITFHHSIKIKNDVCSICYNDGTMLKFNCSHYFHRKCIQKWIDIENDKCPMCRSRLKLGIFYMKKTME